MSNTESTSTAVDGTTTTTTTPAITLYSYPLPNGFKISIALEELNLPYTVHLIDISTLIQKEPWYLQINPNGKIPAITDTSFPSATPNTPPTPIHVFESGAILQYLSALHDPTHTISYPQNTREHWEVQQWLFFQTSGIGPMQGQLIHFTHLTPGDHNEKREGSYAHTRYLYEVKRLYNVLNTRLVGREFIVGDHLSIADISAWVWVWSCRMVGIELEEFPEVKRWMEELGRREAFKRGIERPEGRFDFQSVEREGWEEGAEVARGWVQKGMKKDREALVAQEVRVKAEAAAAALAAEKE